MQVATRVPVHRRARRQVAALRSSVVIGIAGLAWLGIAAAAAWLILNARIVERVLVLDARDPGQTVIGAVALAVALTAPAGLAAIGVARLSRGANRAREAAPNLPPVTRAADRLPPGCTVLPVVALPDGRRIPDVVVGPHGIAFFERLPPPAAARRRGDRWEVRFADGSWRPIENPLARAARDAERVRRHLGADDRDFVVRVHAAVIGDPRDVPRTEDCAVVTLDDVPAWIAALPQQRGLSAARQARLREVLAALG